MNTHFIRRSKSTLTLTQNESGQGLTEYLILLILVSVISISAVQALGSTIKEKIQTARRHINEEVDLKR